MLPVIEKGVIVGHEEQITDPGIEDKRLLVIEHEFASVLQRADRETNTLSAVMRQAWDGSAKLGILTKQKAARSSDAHISVIGHITQNELRKSLNTTEASNGFANRILWPCVRRSKLLPHGGEQVDLTAIVMRLRRAVEFAVKAMGEIREDGETYKMWEGVYADLSEAKSGLYGSVVARGEAQVLRLAVIYALLDCSPTRRKEHLQAALDLWEYCEDSAKFIWGDAIGDGTADEILKALRANAVGMTRAEIREYFSRNKPSAEIDRALGVLQSQGKARVTQEKTGGRPAERWFAV
jgi:hypothetical protein